jgi:hypothetical protein
MCNWLEPAVLLQGGCLPADFAEVLYTRVKGVYVDFCDYQTLHEMAVNLPTAPDVDQEHLTNLRSSWMFTSP